MVQLKVNVDPVRAPSRQRQRGAHHRKIGGQLASVSREHRLRTHNVKINVIGERPGRLGVQKPDDVALHPSQRARHPRFVLLGNVPLGQLEADHRRPGHTPQHDDGNEDEHPQRGQ
jgi:hypothetical protein